MWIYRFHSLRTIISHKKHQIKYTLNHNTVPFATTCKFSWIRLGGVFVFKRGGETSLRSWWFHPKRRSWTSRICWFMRPPPWQNKPHLPVSLGPGFGWGIRESRKRVEQIQLDSMNTTLDGWIPAPVEVGSLSHYVQGFIHPRWCRISCINSMEVMNLVVPKSWFFCAFLLPNLSSWYYVRKRWQDDRVSLLHEINSSILVYLHMLGDQTRMDDRV